MIDYKLAKELKDNGFPQKCGFLQYHYNNNKEMSFVGILPISEWKDLRNYKMDLPNDCVKCPTLSELIEACGEEFENLTKTILGWECNVNYLSDDNEEWTNCETEGKTPEEAVSKLWLELNQK